MFAPAPGVLFAAVACGRKLTLSNTLSMSNRSSRLTWFLIGKRLVSPSWNREKNGCRTRSVRGAQSPARIWIQSGPRLGWFRDRSLASGSILDPMHRTARASVLGALTLVWWGIAVAQPPSASQAPKPGERVPETVALDFYAATPDGNPVADLKAED